ncbi:hypothetical protein QCM77_24620 [Bradyrhizobium sp. SSUT18]|uniref:hypothetical protein n=1 Tax=unclassified Bradyrhizobium TaxID=2631580 RepID=UPI00244A3E70|nr:MULTISPECIES: hypothetical protein [unclassified Bradyrhizobium]MDH2354671.1 hypothetical protein [Bradyrhizobium sp. SSUT112]MDH2403116.1 hypothetical protein [Bradyrhizobium sp. SSUT18]
MATTVTQTSTATPAGQPEQSWLPLQACVDWLLAGPRPQPDDIHNELLQQRTNKTRTLVVAVAASLLIASLSAALTSATWAYASFALGLALDTKNLDMIQAWDEDSS